MKAFRNGISLKHANPTAPHEWRPRISSMAWFEHQFGACPTAKNELLTAGIACRGLQLTRILCMLQFLTNFLMFPYMALRALPVDKPIEEQGPRPPEVRAFPVESLRSLRLANPYTHSLAAESLNDPHFSHPPPPTPPPPPPPPPPSTHAHLPSTEVLVFEKGLGACFLHSPLHSIGNQCRLATTYLVSPKLNSPQVA